jgi:hypothetical protein
MSPAEMREHHAIEGNQASRGIKDPLADAAMVAPAAVTPIVEVVAETVAGIEAAEKRADEEFKWRIKSLR